MQRAAVFMAMIFVAGCTIKGSDAEQSPEDDSEGENGFIGQVIPVMPLVPAPEEIQPRAIEEVQLPECMTAEGNDCVQAPQITDWTCPAGWIASPAATDFPHLICKPPVQASGCAAGHYSPLGTSSCERLGDECPADGWPADIPASGHVIYVKAGSSGSGTSKQDPMGSIFNAILYDATPGATILLAEGTYNENFVVDMELTIRGACAEKTKIETVLGPTANAISISEPATIENLSIDGGGLGLWIETSGTVNLKGISINNSDYAGMFIVGIDETSRVEAEEVSIVSVFPDPIYGGGIGIYMEASEFLMKKGVIEDVEIYGINAHDTDLELEDVSIKDVLAPGTPLPGEVKTAAIAVNDGDVSVDRLLIRDVFNRGYGQQGEGSATLSNLVITGVAEEGVYLEDAELEISQAYIRDCSKKGIRTENAPVTIDRFLIQDIHSTAAENHPSGLTATNSPGVVVSNGVIWNTDFMGISLNNSHAELEDLTLDSNGEVAIYVRDYSTVDMKRIAVNQSRFGILFRPVSIEESFSTANLEDLTIRNSTITGIHVDNGVVLGKRFFIENNPFGILAEGKKGFVFLEEVEIKGGSFFEYTNPDTSEVAEMGGVGLWGTKGSIIEIKDSRFVENKDVNVFFSEQETKGRLSNVETKGSLGNSDGAGGFGLLVKKGATAEMDIVSSKGNEKYGLLVYGEGSFAEVKNIEIKGKKGKKGNGEDQAVLDVEGIVGKKGGVIVGKKGRIEEAGMFGIYVGGVDSKGSFDNFEIKGTMGTGVYVGKKGFVSLDNSAITGSEFSGIVADGEESEVKLNGVMTKGSKGKKGQLDSTNTARLGVEGGDGLALINGSKGVIANSVFNNNERYGVLIIDGDSAAGSNISFSQSITFGNAAGINDNSQNFSMEESQGGVETKGNGVGVSEATVPWSMTGEVSPNMMQQVVVQANIQ